MSDVVSKFAMITNVWNEKENVERMFHRISKLIIKPAVWIWFDDGSTDNTFEEILRVSSSYPELEVWIERMPPKQKGDLNKLGHTYSRFMPRIIERLNDRRIDFFTIQDVGTRTCPNYYGRIMHLMNDDEMLGACSGTVVGEEAARESGLPMGDCKVVRWSIIKTIHRYWDLAPDTFLNIKALAKGYKLKIWRIPVIQDSPTFGLSREGVFRSGQRSYYMGRPFFGVFLRALRRLILRRHGTQMLRGFFYERQRGTWRCDDIDVLRFYGAGKSSIWSLIEIIKTRGKYS